MHTLNVFNFASNHEIHAETHYQFLPIKLRKIKTYEYNFFIWKMEFLQG